MFGLNAHIYARGGRQHLRTDDWLTELEAASHVAQLLAAEVKEPQLMLTIVLDVLTSRCDRHPGRRGWHGKSRLRLQSHVGQFGIGSSCANELLVFESPSEKNALSETSGILVDAIAAGVTKPYRVLLRTSFLT
jgi:hypothetical protein